MTDERILGVILFPFSVIGVWTNFSVLFYFRKVSSLNSSFGIISANQALSNGIYCSLALFYLVPSLIWNIQIMKIYSYHCGFVLYLLYDVATESHLLISINRFTAIYFPHTFSKYFKSKQTYYILTILWVILAIIAVIVFEFKCKMYYEEKYWVFLYSDNDDCSSITFYIDFVFHMIVICCVTFLNICTFLKVRKSNKVLSSTIDQKSSKRKQKIEKSFLKQMFYQSSIYVIALLTYFFVAILIEDNWLRFFVITLPWIIIHSLDGTVIILCNPELCTVCLSKWGLSVIGSNRQTTVVVASVK
ncbi:unnamed protein product [Caenorhabditis angaria]|uniref:G-protein coupled receptors family 1 profile domain-containing protein n=1 Tax=Caenorhabditis angaria TaxID=860376 RepID=A0A9P1N7T8_9PELO|nr:unnamed protein product [Caenorhabditis angaria]